MSFSSPMGPIRIAVPSFLRYDATGNDVAGMALALRRCGCDVAVTAGHWAPEYNELAQPIDLQDPVWDDPDGILIYHFGSYWAEGEELFLRTANRRVLRYHNVTPPEFLEGYHKSAGLDCRRSLESIRRLCQSVVATYWGASAFNVRDLIRFGAQLQDCRVLPPLHRVGDLLTIPVRSEGLAADPDEKVWLFTGAIKPHKGHALLIEALACYRETVNPKARLVLAGVRPDGYELYLLRLKRLIRRLRLEDHVLFTGAIGDAELAAWYRRADVFVCASRHEGFCVPLIEAMAFGTPIVSTADGACAETVGDAGLVFVDRDPWIFAEAAHHLSSTERDRMTMQQSGWTRFEQRFATPVVEGLFLDLVGEVAENRSALLAARSRPALPA